MSNSLPTDATTPVADLKTLMANFVAERRWEKYHLPKNLAASVVIEAGELLELYQWLTPEEAEGRSKSDPAFRQAVADEIADVQLYLLSLCNALGLDLSQTVFSKMERVKKKYPAEEFRGHYERPVNP